MRRVPERLARVAGLLLVPGVAAWAAGCWPPNVSYDLGSTGGSATSSHASTSSSSSSTCGGDTSGVGGGCGEGSLAGVVGDFNNPADWGSFHDTGTTTSLQQGQVVITTDGTPSKYAAAYTVHAVRVTGCRIFVHVTPADSLGPYTTYVSLGDDTNGVEMIKVGNSLQMQATANGAQTYMADVTYDAFAQAWWRIRETGGVMRFETSSDASCWTQQGEAPTPPLDGGVQVNLGLGVPQQDSSLTPDQATFDHLNASP